MRDWSDRRGLDRQLGELGPNAGDRVAVCGDLGERRSLALEHRPDVHEALELQRKLVEPPHAAASSSTTSPAMSTSASAGFDSSRTAESTAPAPASAART